MDAAPYAVSTMFKLTPVSKLARVLECIVNVGRLLAPRRLMLNPESMLVCNVIYAMTRAMQAVSEAIGVKDTIIYRSPR